MDVTRLFTPEYQRDPYPFYDEIRDEGPLARIDGMDGWMASHHEVVRTLLRSPDLRSGMSADFERSGGDEERWRERSPTTWSFVMSSMLFRDGADHDRLRRLVSRAFTPRVVRGLRGRVDAFVEKLLDGICEAREMDLVADFAYPLPLTVIAELLGFPHEDLPSLRQWSRPITAILDGMTRPTHLESAEIGASALVGYLLDQFERKRNHPGEDLLDGLLEAHDEGDRLDDEELVSTCMLLLIAGHETTTNLLANGVLALMRNPAQWQRLCTDPGLVPSAVEELLRYDSPVQFTARRTTREITLYGERIDEDQEIVMLLGAANRDPRQFGAPNELVLDREPNDHLAFGLGSHFCVGSSLARMEAQAALRGLARRIPDLELDADPETLGYRPGFAIRALERLPVRW
jgi:cytochrome P450